MSNNNKSKRRTAQRKAKQQAALVAHLAATKAELPPNVAASDAFNRMAETDKQRLMESYGKMLRAAGGDRESALRWVKNHGMHHKRAEAQFA